MSPESISIILSYTISISKLMHFLRHNLLWWTVQCPEPKMWIYGSLYCS